MRGFRLFKTVAVVLLVCPSAIALEIHSVSKSNAPSLLKGPDARLQLVVTAEDGTDATRQVQYKVDPAGLLEVSVSGHITPLANGVATVSAEMQGQSAARIELIVEQVETSQPINFPNEIVPLFTKHGCNSGGCHGKSGGQNGFRLSLLGFEPSEDYEFLVKEARGRRLFPAAPDHSLLLRKGSGELPHGGGSLFDKGSWDYMAIVRWMEQGMPYGTADDPEVESISVFPASRIVQPGARQQLSVIAHYSDGSLRDITGIATYESNQKEMSEVDHSGLVTMASGQTGDAGVMIRFQEQVSIFQATIPLGVATGNLPPVANFIDEHVFAKLRILGLPASGICDDATFVRRVAIDISGRLPTLEEVDAFMDDQAPDKRAKWIDKLLTGTDYADYFANKWAAILRNKRKGDTYTRGTQAFHEWIRGNLHSNKPYNLLVSELLTAKGEIGHNPAVAWFRNVSQQKEQLQDVSQMFLGVRLQCAECHHHPYEKWSQQDYYGFSAFFSRIGKKKSEIPGEDAVFHKVGLASSKNPKSGASVKPTPLGAEALEIAAENDPREALVDWMTRADNPFFASMLVNRYWKHFFNRGLVEPEDDMRVTNPPTNPPLLAALARHFIKSGYDLKDLVRSICNSTSYQLTAIPNDHNSGDQQNYSRYFPKRLTAEVLLDSIDNITGASTSFAGQLTGTRAVALPDDSYNSSSYFLTVFGRPEMDSSCECERAQGASLAQTLHLLNSKSIQDKLAASGGSAARISGQDDRSDGERVTELYRRAFSRDPVKDELEVSSNYLAKKRAQAGEKSEDVKAANKMAYEDLVWALLNTKEFLFNH